MRKKPVADASWKRYHDRHPEARDKAQKKYRLAKYGLTLGQYEALYLAQDGRCSICDMRCDVLHVDHNHETGRVRELLCPPCNMAIGLLGENSDTILRAAWYLEAHK